MLMDLSKEIMMDLGITVIGDIIAILKHAKHVYRQVSVNVIFCSIWVCKCCQDNNLLKFGVG